MIENIWRFTLGLAVSSLSVAGTMGSVGQQHFNPKESFYAGVGVGGSFSSDTLEDVYALNQNRSMVSINSGQVVGNIYIGYGHSWLEKYFLGIEANTYFPGHESTFVNQGVSSVGVGNLYSNQFTFQDYLGLDLLPGFRFEPNTLVYGRAGLSFRDIQTNQNSSITPSSDGFYAAGHSVGGRFGGGVAYGLTREIGVAVDYFYTYYPTWGAYWSDYNLQREMTSHQNYVGISLLYTS